MNEISFGDILAPGIVSYSNTMENPQKYIDVALAQSGWSLASIHHDGKPSEKDSKKRSSNNLTLRHTYTNPKEFFEISQLLWNYAQLYSAYYRIPFTSMETPQMLHYKKGDGFFVPHADTSKELVRSFSAVLYLNDVEEGGETYFNHFDLTVKPKAGNISMFPANFPYLHEATVPKSGDKFAVVTWFN